MTISKRIYANNAKTTLSASIGPTDTSMSVSDGSRFPQPGTGEYFLATLEASGTIEVIKVTQRSGNVFSGITRAQENTIGSNFLAGTRIDNRVTRDTLSSFARHEDTYAELASLDVLVAPQDSNSATYLCHSSDVNGSPITAVKNTATTWRFETHSIIQATGSAQTGTTTTTLVSTNVPSAVADISAGKYIVQFTTGNNAGYARMATSAAAGTLSWTTALPSTPNVGDQFEIYRSIVATVNDFSTSVDDGLVYSILFSD